MHPPIPMEGTAMIWNASDVFACPNPRCSSKLLVLQGPDELPAGAPGPVCECGTRLERTPLGVSAPGPGPRPINEPR